MIRVCVPAINRKEHILSFEVQTAVLAPGVGLCHVTGNLDRVIEETVQVSLTHIKQNPSLLGAARFDLHRTDLHVHLTDGSIVKEGSSAGVGIALALLLALSKMRNRGNLAVLATGEIDLYGNIHDVGAVSEKLRYFDKAGAFDYMVVPAAAKAGKRPNVLAVESVQEMWAGFLAIIGEGK